MLVPRWCHGGAQVDFKCFGNPDWVPFWNDKSVENPALEQQLEVFLFNLAFLLPNCALREHLQMLKKPGKQRRVVQKQCVSQIGICDNLGGF